MALFIKQIHDLVDLAIDNGISNYWTRTQIDNAIDQAQMGLFRPILKEFSKTKIIRNELLPFQVISGVSLASKTGTLPSNFEHEVEAYYETGGTKYPVKVIEQGMYRRRVLDPIDTPTAPNNLFANIYFNSGFKLEVSNDVSGVVLTYFRRPTKPVYGTTASSGQYVYDATASTDVDWSETMYDIIVEKTLPFLGLGMKDGTLIRANQSPIPKEVSTV